MQVWCIDRNGHDLCQTYLGRVVSAGLSMFPALPRCKRSLTLNSMKCYHVFTSWYNQLNLPLLARLVLMLFSFNVFRRQNTSNQWRIFRSKPRSSLGISKLLSIDNVAHLTSTLFNQTMLSTGRWVLFSIPRLSAAAGSLAQLSVVHSSGLQHRKPYILHSSHLIAD